MFPNVKIMVFLFFVVVVVCRCVSSKTLKIRVSANFGHCFLGEGAKSWVDKWATAGSISGPHFG